MKSFMKSHKASESPYSPSSGSSKTPVSSPKSGLTQSPSPSSPKKLLIPIKNLFNKKSRPSDTSPHTSTHLHESHVVAKKAPSLSANSKVRISSSVPNRLEPKKSVKIVPLDYNSDSGSSVNSNDSNFSFVRDMKGGRNTSIKYYKTKKPEKIVADKVYFDSNVELDDIDDYDFENNGLGEQDEDFDYEESEEPVPSAMDFEEPTPKLAPQHPIHVAYSGGPGVVPKVLDYGEESASVYDDFESDLDDRESDFYRKDSFAAENRHSVLISSHTNLSNQNNLDEPAKLDSPFLEGYPQMASQDSFGDVRKPFEIMQVGDLDDDVRYAEKSSSSFDFNDYKYPASSPDRLFAVNDRQVFNKSYHFSISGQISSSEDSIPLVTESLEDYLNIDSLRVPPPISPMVESFDDLKLFDLNSPIINGLTIGNSATARFRNLNASNITSFRNSLDEVELAAKIDQAAIATPSGLATPQSDTTPVLARQQDLHRDIESEQMATDILGMLEKKPEPPVTGNIQDSPTIKRNSVNDMMNLLESLQTKTDSTDKRKSVENMMNFLKTIQDDEDHESEDSPEQLQRSESQARRSALWVHNEDVESFFSNNQSYNELNENEIDLLDEINQLPDDFDFDQIDEYNNVDTLSSFMRSNSFNKRPKKVLPASHVASNRIHTSNKTVTYYGNKPSVPLAKPKVPSNANVQLSPITEKDTPKIAQNHTFGLGPIKEDRS